MKRKNVNRISAANALPAPCSKEPRSSELGGTRFLLVGLGPDDQGQVEGAIVGDIPRRGVLQEDAADEVIVDVPLHRYLHRVPFHRGGAGVKGDGSGDDFAGA